MPQSSNRSAPNLHRPATSKSSYGGLVVWTAGLATTVVTAAVLALLGQRGVVDVFSVMLWFGIPIGAMAGGIAAASGFFFAARALGHRPRLAVFLTIILGAGATFLLRHYVDYRSLEVEGRPISSTLGFLDYVDSAVRSASMSINLRARRMGDTGPVGSGLGWSMATIQMLGFAGSGAGLVFYLLLKPYCRRCSRYLAPRARVVRYYARHEPVDATVERLYGLLDSGQVQAAAYEHAKSGRRAQGKGDDVRLALSAKRCPQCLHHVVEMELEVEGKDDWRQVSSRRVTKDSVLQFPG